jgi:hypothetical protein
MSSDSDSTVEEARAKNTTDRRTFLNVIRRMKISLTSETFWQGVGVLLLDRQTKQTTRAEVFPGIGFFSRPHPAANAEEIVAYESGAENPYVVATRDEGTRRKVAKLDQDETAMFNTKAIFHATKAGNLLAYLAGHIADAVGLAKTSELNDLRAFVAQQFSGAGHVHAVSGSATTAVTPVILPVPIPSSDYTGTTVLKAQ